MNNHKKKDKYKASEKEKFVNPYHFVSLEKNCTREKTYKEQKGTLTGWINCCMETLSPVFIPNTSSASELDGNKHSDVFEKRSKGKEDKTVVINSYDFFSYTDLSKLKGDELKEYREPIIPGSEIRGMIRSTFEAVTNSCLSTIDNEQPLFKRVQTPAKAGRLKLENGQWKIQPCERLGIAFRWTYGDKQDFSGKIKNLKEGQEIYIKRGDKYRTKKGFPAFTVVSAIKEISEESYELGYFHKGEPFGKRKHHESVFVIKSEPDIDIDESSVKNYIKNLDLYKSKNVNLHLKKGEHSGYKDIVTKNRELKDFEGSLLYYIEHNNHYYLCPAAIGREVFYKRLTNLVGNYKPCNQINNKIDDNELKLCPACALFGIAGKESAASRVRFTDAFVSNKRDKIETYYDEVRILKELAGPKLSATEFYLKKNPGKAHLWNYDYAVNWETHKYGISGYIPEIRGRKFYWHHANPDPYIAKEKENDPEYKYISDRNVAVRPLKKNVSFQFKVYFNDITESELKRLLWVLTIGDKKENAHKMGMGKPIGLGSVQVNVTEVNVREISMTNDSVEYVIEDKLAQYNISKITAEDLGCSEQILGEYLFLTQLAHTFSNIIAYPSNVDEKENFEWFMANKKVKGTGINPIIENPLPHVKKPELPKYIRIKSNSN
ncbi:MAG: TIGR03986 family CRISPR-associated RAMP protein [Acidobacteria bacterium]|jgi:CRISPR-associated protein (TIGR03986 family)|nr:TIGR03986 family CRISPR-associated RAMP protein [Acidobacteriota bacterium]